MTLRLVFASLATALSLGVVSSNALAQADPVRVPALYNRIFVADGYDSNDQVQIMGEGRFRSTCYRHTETTVSIDEATKVISLGPVAYEYKGYCLQVILPFQRTIDIGILKPGKWTVQQAGSLKLGEFTVRKATTDSADDFLYAPVTQAFFRKNVGGNEVLLSGEFSNDCMTMDTVKLSVQPDVILVQPIAKVESRSGCQDGKFPFEETVAVPSMAPGRYLLHVRATGGNALSSIVEVN